MAATTTTTTTTLATATTGNSTNITVNSDSNTIANNSSHSQSSSLTANNTNTPASAAAASVAGVADAATVAAAKDMLQLHHGAAAALNNNNNNNSNNNSSSNVENQSNSNNNNSVNHPPAHLAPGGTQPENAYGELRFNQDVLYIVDPVTVIGRNSSTSMVHFHVAENNLVSRKHFQVLFDTELRAFFVQCLSKNGIFVDDFLQRRNVDPLRLPQRCYFRFPSTDIRIEFESYMPGTITLDVSQQHLGAPTALAHGIGTASGVPVGANSHHNSSAGVAGGGGGSGGSHVIMTPPTREELQTHQTPLHHSQQQQPQLVHHHLQQQQSHHPHYPHPHSATHSPHPLHHTTPLQQQPQQQQQQQQRSGSANAGSNAAHLLPSNDGTGVYTPLKITIPKKEQKSPYLSPTGTISAANSCPASPRQGFHQNQPNNYNYSNNNTQDLFQTPSTASYNHNEKPPYSYAQLIVQAISAAPDKQLTLSGIYSFIVKHYPYYRKETNKGWQNSIRHNLSLNRYFIKVARSQDEPGKGSFWRIDPDSGAKLIDHSYKKRRQRSSQGFRPPYGMPRSAPVSPSHMDNSRESSPLQDIVLQSAPGSPGMSLEQRAADAEIMYNSQNTHQQQQQLQPQTLANNSNQYNSGSPYYVTNQNTAVGVQQQQAHSEANSGGGGGGTGNGGASGVGALIALKRNHVITVGHPATATLHQSAAQQQHPEIIYEEVPTDYSGHMETVEDADGGGADATVAKRPKYVSEVL